LQVLVQEKALEQCRFLRRNEKTMKKLNGDKKKKIVFNPKNDDQHEKNENIKKNMISSPCWLR